jgi:hypothetical protein
VDLEIERFAVFISKNNLSMHRLKTNGDLPLFKIPAFKIEVTKTFSLTYEFPILWTNILLFDFRSDAM